ncbi:PEGA domain-containing protein, partial [Myxococcota bacterium]|nr:PEGA domain-containing protein [Myxococcota bacterium]
LVLPSPTGPAPAHPLAPIAGDGPELDLSPLFDTREDPERAARAAKERFVRGVARATVVAIAVIAGSAVAWRRIRPVAPPPEAPKLGRLMVRSTPEGAAIIVDGQATGHVTPSTIDGLPTERPLVVAVRLAGHRATPADAELQIPASTQQTQATFVLRPGLAFRVETEPEGATIDVNGVRAPSPTPVELPVLPFGESATVTLTLEGHLPASVVLTARAGTSTAVRVALETARTIDVASEPSGARVSIDGAPRGETPLYELAVPGTRAFTVAVDKRGYKPWRRRIGARKVEERTITAELEALPLLSIPMSKADRAEAKELDRKVTLLASTLRAAKLKLARLEKRLADVEAEPNVFIGRITEAQSAVDDARTAIERLEEQRTELEQQLDQFRQRVMGTPE